MHTSLMHASLMHASPMRRAENADERHGTDVDGDEPRQAHRLPHLFGHPQAGVDPQVGDPVCLPGTVIVLGRVKTVFANVFSDYDNRGGDCPVPLSPTFTNY